MEDYKKKYEEALARAKYLKENTDSVGALDVSACFEKIFPELAKNEDDVFKELFYNLIVANACTPSSKEIFSIYGKTKEDCLAWLEKQGEHKNFTPKSATEAIKEEKIDNANKVEPKFKVGDWIVDKSGFVQQVIDFRNRIYTCTYNSFTTNCESNYHLWTIQDAKDSDVLASDNGVIILVKESRGSSYGYRLSYHCAVLHDGTFEPREFYVEPEKFFPATKEQHKFFFKKMEEAGYRWDDIKKELIRYGQ